MAILDQMKDLTIIDAIVICTYLAIVGAITIFGAAIGNEAMWISGMAFLGMPGGTVFGKLWSARKTTPAYIPIPNPGGEIKNG